MAIDYYKLTRLVENYAFAAKESERLQVAEEESRDEFLSYLSECREAEQTVAKQDDDRLHALAAGLREHNAWQRSEGKYAWHEEDGAVVDTGAPNPHTPAELGALLDEAADALDGLAK